MLTASSELVVRFCPLFCPVLWIYFELMSFFFCSRHSSLAYLETFQEHSAHILKPAFQEPTHELPAGNLYLNSMCYAERAFSEINDWRGRILILETPN